MPVRSFPDDAEYEVRSGDESWRRVEDPSFETLLGPLWYREEEGKPAFALQTEGRHSNRSGVVHGGVLAFLADHALGRSLSVGADWPRQATIQLEIQYIVAVRPGDFVEARAEVLRSTAHVAFLRGLLSVRGRVVAQASGVWKLSRRGKRTITAAFGADSSTPN